MNDLDIHSLSGAYAVHALEEAERALFETHLAGCPTCRHEVESLCSAATHLASLTEVRPPASLRAAILREISSVRPLPPLLDDPREESPQQESPQQQESPREDSAPEEQPAPPTSLEDRRARRHMTHPVRWLAAAAAAVAIVLGGTVWQPWQQGQTQLTATQQVLRADDAQRYTQQIGTASATVVRSPSVGRAVILTNQLPPPPQGHVYELWLQSSNGTMVRAGLLPTDGAQQLRVPLQGNAAAAIGAGVTVEPAGGSEKPTTKPIALFSFA